MQETIPSAKWHFIPGKENPADLATRGLTPIQLSQCPSWWSGPIWLQQSTDSWPNQLNCNANEEALEERPAVINASVRADPDSGWNLLTRYSDLRKLLRITAMCKRFVLRLKRKANSVTHTPLTTQELEEAKYFWSKIVQQYSFGNEKKLLSEGKSLPQTHRLTRLTPFVDSQQLIRVGGRIKNSPLTYNLKHPIILPRESPFTQLVLADAHRCTLHGGTQDTLAYFKNTFWILGGRILVSAFIGRCVRCQRYRKQRSQQLMGQLPADRVTPSRAFLNSGVDYAGPLQLKTWRGRNARTYKAYIALFVCHSTSAIHLELVTDYTSDAFIAACKRFTARRGICKTLRSDCGTNLKGADPQLQALFSSSSQMLGRLSPLLANDGTEWIFNPPAAPHFGGKWEAGVKSVKHHLRRVTGNILLTYEEMSTLLLQIEAVLNSKPLSPLTEDPDDLSVLTPGHFLIGHPLTVISDSQQPLLFRRVA